jgi:P27 family predicted phage terminase small subunit
MPQPKKPTALKKLQGTDRKDRILPDEFKPTLEVKGDIPDVLNEWGSKLWVDLFDEYSKFDLISRVDVGSLMVLCNEFGRYCEADDLLKAQGLEVVEDILNRDGDIVGQKKVINPLIKVVSDAFKNYKSMCTEFGLTPASRTKISAPPKEKNIDPLELLM